jgi:uroporphyrinogen decarboxylase
MTSKQRVLTTLGRGVPDRVPIDYLANAGIDERLKRHFGLSPDDHEGLRRRLGVDFAGVNAAYVGPRLHAEMADRQVDPQLGIRTRYIEHGSGGYWDYCDFPLAGADEETMDRWPLPKADDFDYALIPARCREAADLAIAVGHAGTGDVINSTGMLCGMENVLVGLISDDPALLRLIDRKLNLQLEVVERTLERAAGAIDFLWLGEDLGTQIAPMISLELFRRHIRPRHQKMIDIARSFDLPVMIHTCGSSSWAYDDFIEMGVSAVDTLQPEAANMAPAYLKRRFGDRLAFHGCISTAGPVSFGSVEDVVRDCRQVLGVMMPGGGYCFSPTHCLQDNSPTENVVAMYETAQRFGGY